MSNVDRITSLHLRNEVQFFTFTVDESGDRFAINIFKVKEVINYKDKLVDIFYDVPFVDGMVSVRGISIPSVDMRKWFFYRGNNNINLDKFAILDDSYLVMICDFSGVLVGIRIKKALGILTKSWEDFVRNEEDKDHQKIIGYTKDNDNKIIQLVDVEKMIAEAFPFIEEAKEKELERVQELKIEDKLILVADDSSMVLKGMERILKKLEVKYKLFKNGQELLDFIFETSPNEIFAIITDLEMPVASGFEVIKQVKASKEYSKIPIIVNSSMSGKSNEEMAKSLNADGFVSKTNPKEIEASLRKLLTSK